MGKPRTQATTVAKAACIDQPLHEQGDEASASGEAACEFPRLSEFERRCLEHVQRTAEYLASLGLLAPEPPVEGAGPTHGVFAPKRLGGLSDITGAASVKRRRLGGQRGEEGPVCAEEPEQAEVLEASRRWLCESRAAILAPGLGGAVPSCPGEWRREAVRRWGEAVPPEPQIRAWASYVLSRLPTPPPPSPLDLMQERYAYDPWRLLVTCVLMARISSERVKTETIAAFFARFPSPSLMLLATAAGGLAAPAQQELAAILRPLGLVDNRTRTLTELSRAFLQMPAFDCGHQQAVNKIWGCGAFAVDSYLIFCRGRRLLQTADASCQQYLEWWQQQPAELVPRDVDGESPVKGPAPADRAPERHESLGKCAHPVNGDALQEIKALPQENKPLGLHRFFRVVAA